MLMFAISRFTSGSILVRGGRTGIETWMGVREWGVDGREDCKR